MFGMADIEVSFIDRGRGIADRSFGVDGSSVVRAADAAPDAAYPG